MKSWLDAIPLVTAQLAGNPPSSNLWVMAVADEEHSSLGAQAALGSFANLNMRIDGGIITEPTDLKLCVAHRGFGWVSLKTQGRTAHTSQLGEGIDAIAHIGRVIVPLEQLDYALQQRQAHNTRFQRHTNSSCCRSVQQDR